MLDFYTCDVFTSAPFSGNPLAIVEGADELSTAQMQTIAREFNLSETIFVQTPDDPAHSAKVRIFFPTAEIPFAGHPTIGCAIHLALKNAEDGDFETQITLEELAGLVPVTVTRRAGIIHAEFVAPVLPFAKQGRISATLAAEALGLSERQIGFGGQHVPGLWQGGPAFAYIPVRDIEALSQARPIEPGWSALGAATGLDNAYLYTQGDSGICDYAARMFAPDAGIPEDPATGSASAILAAQLLASNAITSGETRLTLHQGVQMGRPSEITLTAVSDGNTLQQVRIAGSAVPISSGRITIPSEGTI